MTITQKINQFIETLSSEEENLFPYLHNQNYVKGESNIYYSGPYWDNQEIEAAITNLFTGKWLASGEAVNKFEKEFSKRFDFENSVMVNSGSSANLVMIAALKKYFDWQDGDEIIVSVCGFPTTINPIIQNNLKPVFVDIDYSDLNWDIQQIRDKITPKTRAIFSSPVLANPYDYHAILDICNDHNIHLIADNCDSLGSKWKGEYLTKHAVASSCSFYPAHHITTIEGGMVSSNIKEVIDLARSFAWWGRDCYCVGKQNLLSCGSCGKRFDTWLTGYDKIVDHKYVFGQVGYNLKPIDMQGAIGSVQLKKFDEVHSKRRSNKEKLHKIFESIPGVRVINERPEAETSWFGVPIVCENKTALVKFLEDSKIQTRNYFAGNLLIHPAYRHLESAFNYPNAMKVLDNVFFVGCSPVITDPMIEYIEETVNLFKTTVSLSV
jgi:CDP-6-deoxy-D-xylo-4-hexulose-3-dehydrase